MSTSYSIHFEPCEHCGIARKPIEIGQISGGPFFLQLYDDMKNLQDWTRIWNLPGAFIQDEFGRRLSADAMLKIIGSGDGWVLCPRE